MTRKQWFAYLLMLTLPAAAILALYAAASHATRDLRNADPPARRR